MATLVLKNNTVVRLGKTKYSQVPRKQAKWHLSREIVNENENCIVFYTVCKMYFIIVPKSENIDVSEIKDVKAEDVCIKCLGAMEAIN